MILFEGISKKYPIDNVALENISFKIGNGEFVFLTGNSGAGKTTILRLLIKDILPTGGSIFLDDWEINRLPSRQLPYLRRKVSLVFQDFKLLTDRTVAENIAVTLEIAGKSDKEAWEKIHNVLKIIKLENKGNYFPGQLSLGEQQRVAIGRAIVGDAKILLADEPTGNLDPKTSWEILKIINDINKMGTTVLMATHNVDIVNSLKKRVIMLKDGKIVKDEKKSRY
ncbi:cell division ATP-binding protein FtsE [Candidatus Microgenomates bacterium]|nr:cell division ATP-binding protein FtsE [Candidatus Microgenomates bacterium]